MHYKQEPNKIEPKAEPKEDVKPILKSTAKSEVEPKTQPLTPSNLRITLEQQNLGKEIEKASHPLKNVPFGQNSRHQNLI
jgi:hypothetical protein